MRTARILGSALALSVALTGPTAMAKPAAPAKAQPAKAAAGALLAELDLQRAGAWATKKIMQRDYLALLQEKATAKHPKFAKAAMDVLGDLEKNFDSHGQCAPNLRIAFARIVAGAIKGAPTEKLTPVLKPVLSAFATASKSKAKDGGLADVAKAIAGARKGVKDAAYRKSMYGALVWLRKPCNLFAAKGKGEKLAKPVKAPTKSQPVKVELDKVAGGPFARFKTQLGEALVPVKAYYESLKGPNQRGYLVLARGLLLMTSHLETTLTKLGKSGLGLEGYWLRAVRDILTALAVRKYDTGEAATRWAFAALDGAAERLRAVFRTAGLKGAGFAGILQARFKALKFKVRGISSGKVKWVPGSGRKDIADFNAKITAAYKKILAGIKPKLAVAKDAWKEYLDGYLIFLTGPSTPVFGDFKPVFFAHEKAIAAWVAKDKVGTKQYDAHGALLRGLGYIVSEGRIVGAQIAGNGTLAAMTGLLAVIPEAVGAAAKKGLVLGKGLGKFIVESVKKYAAVFSKLPGAAAEFAAYITGPVATAVAEAVKRAHEVRTGKSKLEPGKATFWFRTTLAALRKAFPAKFNAVAFEKNQKASPPKALTDFFASLAK